MDQGITSKSALQVGFPGILLCEQAAVCRLFPPGISTYPSRHPGSRGYVRKQTKSTQEYFVSESILSMLKMAVSLVSPASKSCLSRRNGDVVLGQQHRIFQLEFPRYDPRPRREV